MRVFTEQEKWILRKVAAIKKEKNMHSISLIDICTVFLNNEYLKINYHAQNKFYSLSVLFNENIYSLKKDDVITEKQVEIENKIIDTIFLLKFLKENNLLFEITDTKTSDELNILKKKYDTSNHLTFQTNFDSLTNKLVVETLVNKRYFIRQEFFDFINNDFKTPEDYRFKKTHIATWTGITIAFIIGAIGIYLGAIPNKSTIRIDEEQIRQFESSIQLINNNQERILLIDSTLLNSINDSIGVLNSHLISIKNVSTIKIDQKQYMQLESLITKTQNRILQIESILINSTNDSIVNLNKNYR